MAPPKLTVEDLSALFEPDNIRDGKSVEALASWDGYQGLEKALRTNFQRGIINDPKDHDKRRDDYGDNQPIIKPPPTIMELILENFEDEMLRILCASAVVSLVLGIATEGLAEGWLEGASILLAVVIIVSVTSTNNYLKQKQFQKLNALATAKNINVIRGGQLLNISVYDLLVGDVVEIETGEILSVDGILVEGHNISIDESSITGETIEIKKKVPKTFEPGEGASPFLISSSRVMEGTGLMVVAAVGKNSYYGKLKMKIQAADDTTPLQEKLSVLADQVGQVGMYSAAATFTAMFVHYVYDCSQSDSFVGTLFSIETIHEIIEYFIIAVSIVVVAVPEGLPLAVTIALAYSVNKMKDENNLVRYLQACETMGGANNICSDKTGTLTKNLMTVTKIYLEQEIRDVIAGDIAREHTIRILCLSVCNNTSASPTIARQGNDVTNNQVGNKTECALLEMAFRMGYDYKKFRNKENQLKIFPFSSERKKMATVYADEKGVNYVFVKGAPDFLLEHCSRYINKNGSVSKINTDFINQIKETIEIFAAESLRTILLTYKEVNETPEEWDEIESDLIIIGMVGIKDPLRDGIKRAVEQCHSAGVRVRMVTGDNKNTAIAIAKEAGILPEDYEPQVEGIDTTVMEGKVFREYVGGLVKEGEGDDAVETVGNMNNFIEIANNLCVLARSSPDDKYLMATGLKQLGNVVAMTGDGTNDAPALKKADIGFAMGIAGTEVAKEASGIILLDDNFSSIVTAMKWGRNIFDCIRKFLQFQLTVNFAALVMAFVGGAVLRESPLNPIQMLWVNLIMDTLASLALATEPPTDELLTRKPYSRNESLITANMWKNIICQGLMQVLVLGTILFKGPELLNIPSSIGVSDWNEETGKHYSIFFNVFVLLQIFNEINARKLKHSEANVFENFFNNPLFLIIVVSTIVIQLTMVKYGGKSLKTVELSFKENLLCIILGSFSLVTGLLVKSFLPENLIICPRGVEFGNFSYYWSKKASSEHEQ